MDILIAKYHLHPIVDHFTIALCAAGMLADITACVIGAIFPSENTRPKKLSVRLSKTAAVLLVPGAVSAVFSRFTGESGSRGSGTRFLPLRNKFSFLMTDPGGFSATQCWGHT